MHESKAMTSDSQSTATAQSQEPQQYTIKVQNPYVPAGAYRDGIRVPLSHLFPFLSNREKSDLLYKKLMLERADADQGAYIQAACELTVCAWFAFIARQTCGKYVYELKLSPPKDVDCALWYKEYQFNIEIKCADYSKQRQIVTSSNFVVHGLGRLTDYSDLVGNLQQLFDGAVEPATVGASHHMDCKMKDYLLSAQEKFGSDIEQHHLNVLFVAVDCQMDMTKWIAYLNGPQGLFTDESFEAPDNYKNVDLVVFSNLYHRHSDLEKKSRISQHWALHEAFNFAVVNPRSTKSDEILKSFWNVIPFENNALHQYLKNSDIPLELQSGTGLSYFVGHQIENGIQKFQGYADDSCEVDAT